MLRIKKSVVVNARIDDVFGYLTSSPPRQLWSKGMGTVQVQNVVTNEQIVFIVTSQANPLGSITDRYSIHMEPYEAGTLIEMDAEVVPNFLAWIFVVMAFPFALLRWFTYSSWLVPRDLKRIKTQVETGA